MDFRDQWTWRTCDACQHRLRELKIIPANEASRRPFEWFNSNTDGSVDKVCSAAISGCMICLYVSSCVRSAIRLQETLDGFNKNIPEYIARESLEKKDREYRDTRREAFYSWRLAVIRRQEVTEDHIPSYIDSVEVQHCSSMGTLYLRQQASEVQHLEPDISVVFEISQSDELGRKETQPFVYELLIVGRTKGIGYENSLYLVDWTDIDVTASASIKQLYTGSPESLELARQWFKECVESHPSCNGAVLFPQATSTFYPTRLLKLENNTVRLVETNEESSPGPYATLSHCWGIEKFMNLTHETYDALRAGKVFSDFPLSFNHAMTFVQSLGIDYLWIDCYCIIQGDDERSREDWAFESQQMGQVYANGIINVGASHASKPTVGCFARRDSQRIPYATITLGTDVVYKVIQEYDLTKDSFHEARREAIFTRGWCIQERMLCRRMVYFHREDIRWQCAKYSELTENRPNLPPPRVRDEYLMAHAGVLTSIFKTVPTGIDVEFFWCKLVDEFTKCKLTRPSQDKLRAVEGIARYIAALTNDAYTVGHFLSRLPRSLCWQTGGKVSHSERDLPSWCWASLDGPIRSESILRPRTGERGVPVAVPLAVLVHPRSISELADVETTPSILTFIGRLISVRIVGSKGPIITMIGSSEWSIRAMFDIRDERDAVLESKCQLYLFPIFYWDNAFRSDTLLLLIRRKDGTYRRCGVADYWSRDMDDKWRPQLDWLEQFTATKPSIIMLS